MKQPHTINIARNCDGSPDQIDCRICTVVLEQMSKNQWFLDIDNGEETARIFLTAKKGAKIKCSVEKERNGNATRS